MNISGEPSWVQETPDENSVQHLGGLFADHLRAPLVIYLRGDLGAGKTTFARALIRALGFAGRVKSPSYGLLESYRAGGMNLLHLDLYRIEDAEELDYLAIRDLFDSETILLIEWPEKGEGNLPAADLELIFTDEFHAEDGCSHRISCLAKSDAGNALSNAIMQNI
jgi:tRNA threonylcarbamoyladenosine biosynthesis protein TsaE